MGRKRQSYDIRRKKRKECIRLKRSLLKSKAWDPQVKVENDREDQDDEARLDDDPFIKSEAIETEELDGQEDLQDLISLGEAVRVKVEENDDEEVSEKKEVCKSKAWTTKRARAAAKTKKATERKTQKAIKKNVSSETPKKRRPYKKISEMTPEELAEHRKALRRKKYKRVSDMTPEELKEYQDRCRKRYKKVSEMTPEEVKEYQDRNRQRYKYKKVSEMTPEELETYNVYKERMRLRYHSTKAAREEGESGESRSWKYKRVSEMTPKELEAYEKHKERMRLAYKSKDVSDMTPEELEAYNAKKERARIHYQLTKAANGESKTSKSSSWKLKRVSEMTPEELEAYNKAKERRKQKYKKLSELDPEELERQRAKKRDDYHRRKTADMTEEEKAKYYEMYVMKMARRLELAEKRKSVTTVKKQAKRGRKLKLEKKPLDPEEEQRLKRERYQRMMMTRIERMAQMTEEEKEELRRRKYERRMAILAAYPPEERERRMKLWEKSDRYRRNSLSCFQRMKNEGKYSELQQKYKRQRTLKGIRRKLKVQELVSQGKSYEEIQVQLETPSARERRLTYLRLYKAKKDLREELEADGVPPEEIERQVEEFAKTYKPTTPLKPYKPRKKYLLEPVKPEEMALLQSAQNASPSTKPEKTKRAKHGKKDSDSAATTFSSFSVKQDAYATPSTSNQNQYEYQPIPSQIFQPEQQTYNGSAQDQQNCHSQCQSESSIYSGVNDVDVNIVEASRGQSSCSNYDDDYHDDDHDDNGFQDDSPSPVLYTQTPASTSASVSVFASASVLVPSTSSINDEALAAPSMQPASGLLSSYFSRAALPLPIPTKTNPPKPSLPPVPSFSPLSDSGKKVGRPIGRSKAKSQVVRNSTCEICGNSYRRAEFLEHMRNLHHPYFQNFHCTICCQRFKPPAFQKHFQDVHIANGDVSWDSLDPIFRPRRRRQVFLAGTSLDVNADKVDPCEVCGKILDRKNMFAHKARLHNPYYNELSSTCSLCEKVIVKALGETFYKHFVSAHPEMAKDMLRNPNPRKIPTHSNENNKKHICDKCGQGFLQRTAMRTHQYYTHGAGALKENFYKCQDCPEERLFKYKSQYKNHCKEFHPGKYTPTQCPLCLRGVETEREKNKHIKEMHPDRYWPCEYCNVVRISEVALLTHYSRNCSKITREERLRWREEKGDVTIDKMEVKCELCNVELILDSLRRHVRDMHKIKEEDYPCWKCEKTFKWRLFLGVHLMEVHDMLPEDWLERVAKVNVPNVETVKRADTGKKYDPPDWRKKKRLSREPKKHRKSSGNVEGGQVDSEKKKKRRRRPNKGKAVAKFIVNEEEEEEEESDGGKSESEEDCMSSESESDDEKKGNRKKTKEPRETEPKRKSARTRTLKRKSFKDYDSDEDKDKEDEEHCQPKAKSAEADAVEDQLGTEVKKRRRGRPKKKAKAHSAKRIVNENDEPEVELDGKKSESDQSEGESMSSHSDDDRKSSRRKTKEPRWSEPKRKSTRTRTLKRKSFKDDNSKEDCQAKIKSRARVARSKPNLLIVDDDVKLSKMKSSVSLLKMELDTVCYYHGIQMTDQISVDHVYA